MIKQRYIRHQAINKQGEVVATGFETAKKVYPFGTIFKAKQLGTLNTSHFMQMFGHAGNVLGWKRYVYQQKGPVRFTKAIVYVG